ncbi:MAG: hypothetical protein ACK5LO_07420 [Leucobacter sp.]
MSQEPRSGADEPEQPKVSEWARRPRRARSAGEQPETSVPSEEPRQADQPTLPEQLEQPEALSPDSTPEQLARLAAERPELRGAIREHPSADPELVGWIDEQSAPAAAGGERLSERGRKTLISVLVAALVLGGGAAVLDVTGLVGKWFGVWQVDDSSAQSVLSNAEKESETEIIKAGAIPSFIPAKCPKGTDLLAWAELTEGWLVACGEAGTDLNQPSFMRVQLPGEEEPVDLSDPTWFADNGQYTGGLPDGGTLTFDGPTGVVVLQKPVDDPAAEVTEGEAVEGEVADGEAVDGEDPEAIVLDENGEALGEESAETATTRTAIRAIRMMIAPLWGEDTVQGFEHGVSEAWTTEAISLAGSGTEAAFPTALDRRADEGWSDAPALIDGAVITEVHADGGQEAVMLSALSGQVVWREDINGGEYDSSTVQCVPDPEQKLAYCLLTEYGTSEIVVLSSQGEVRQIPLEGAIADIAVDERGIAAVGYGSEGTLLRMDHDGGVLWESEPIDRAAGVVTGIDFMGDRVLVRTTGGWELLEDATGERLAGFAYPTVLTVDDTVVPCEARLQENTLQISGPECPDDLTANGIEVERVADDAAQRWYLDAGFMNWRGPGGILVQTPVGDRITYYSAG